MEGTKIIGVIFHMPDGENILETNTFPTDDEPFTALNTCTGERIKMEKNHTDENGIIHYYPAEVKEDHCCSCGGNCKCHNEDAYDDPSEVTEDVMNDAIDQNAKYIHPKALPARDAEPNRYSPELQNYLKFRRFTDAVIVNDMAEDMGEMFKQMYRCHLATMFELMTQDDAHNRDAYEKLTKQMYRLVDKRR